MKKEDDFNIFIKNFPIFKSKKKSFLIFLYHLIIFLTIIIILWAIRSYVLIAVIPAQFFVTLGANFPLIYILINFDKLRNKYLHKYEKNPWQHLLLHYSFTSPLGCAAFYFPLLLVNYDFLPSVVRLPAHFLTNNIFPFYISIPFGVLIIIFGLLLFKPSGDKDRDMDLYLYMIDPDKSRIVKEGIYRYIRHPRILIRFTVSFGFALIANNLLAISVSVIHYIPYSIYFYISDNELSRRFGDKFDRYREEVPALIPRLTNWGNFLRTLISREK